MRPTPHSHFSTGLVMSAAALRRQSSLWLVLLASPEAERTLGADLLPAMGRRLSQTVMSFPRSALSPLMPLGQLTRVYARARVWVAGRSGSWAIAGRRGLGSDGVWLAYAARPPSCALQPCRHHQPCRHDLSLHPDRHRQEPRHRRRLRRCLPSRLPVRPSARLSARVDVCVRTYVRLHTQVCVLSMPPVCVRGCVCLCL